MQVIEMTHKNLQNLCELRPTTILHTIEGIPINTIGINPSKSTLKYPIFVNVQVSGESMKRQSIDKKTPVDPPTFDADENADVA